MKNYKSGLKYGFIFMGASGLMGALYGIWSGIVFEPAVFAITIVGVFVAMNFSVSLLACIPWGIGRIVSKNNLSLLSKYIGLSFGFFTVFFPYFILLKLIPFTPF